MQEKKEMNQDTVELLSEINSGCKMAIDSIQQVGKYVDDKKLTDIIKKYNDEHIQMEDTTHRILNSAGVADKEPGAVAKAFATMQANIKLMIKDDIHQAASILTDGCNMGIKSLSEFKNRYTDADKTSVDLCQKLCDIETRMVGELQPLL